MEEIFCARPSSHVQSQPHTLHPCTEFYYVVASSHPGESQYSLFEETFRESVHQIYGVPWGVQSEWFTLLDSEQCTLLVRALREKGDTVWSQFLACHMPLDSLMQCDSRGMTAYAYAACHRAFGTLTLLLERHPGPDFDAQAILLPSIRGGYEKLARQLINRLPIHPPLEVDEQGKDALDWAWEKGWMDQVVELVKRALPCRLVKLDEYDDSLLERAMQGGHDEIAAALTRRLPASCLQPIRPFSESVTRAYTNQQKPHILERALRFAGEEVALMLIAKLPCHELFCQDHAGRNGLYHAIALGRERCAQALAQRIFMADHIESSMEEYSLLHLAALEGSVELLELLQVEDLEKEISVTGQTALHLAINMGHRDFALQLAQSLSPTAFHKRDARGHTVLDLAIACGLDELVGVYKRRCELHKARDAAQ